MRLWVEVLTLTPFQGPDNISRLLTNITQYTVSFRKHRERFKEGTNLNLATNKIFILWLLPNNAVNQIRNILIKIKCNLHGPVDSPFQPASPVRGACVLRMLRHQIGRFVAQFLLDVIQDVVEHGIDLRTRFKIYSNVTCSIDPFSQQDIMELVAKRVSSIQIRSATGG